MSLDATRRMLVVLTLLVTACVRESRIDIDVSLASSTRTPVEKIAVIVDGVEYPLPPMKPGETRSLAVSLRATKSMMLSWKTQDKQVTWEGPDLDPGGIRALHLLLELQPDPKHPVRHKMVRR